MTLSVACDSLRRAETGWAVTAAVALGASAVLAVGALLVGLTVPRVRVPVAVAVAPGGIFLALRVGD